MTTVATERAAGVTVVVGDGDLAARVEGHRLGPVVKVADYLEALGEMGRGGVRAVIGRVGPLAGAMEPTVRALRELGGDCRLVLCADGDEEPAAMKAVRLGFDDYLIQPVRAEELRHALGGPTGRPSATPATPTDRIERSSHESAAADCPADRLPAPQPGGFTGKRETDRSIAPASAPAPQTQSAARRDGAFEPRAFLFQPASASTPESAADPNALSRSAPRSAVAWRADEDLSATRVGDIELVEQLLRDRRGTMDLALGAIRQRLPGHDVRYSAERVDSARSCLPVVYGNHTLGFLVSDTAAEQWLSGYAAWLGRWMMLARHIDHLNELALRDDLTGVWNRRYFSRFLDAILRRARRERFRVTLMVYDIDDFKTYNDRYGHEAGDEILIETARLMQSVVRKHDVVARIGGDEFAVVFWDAEVPRGKGDHPHTVRAAAQRFQHAVCQHRFPKLADELPATLTISGGLAGYPWDGQSVTQLMRAADQMLLESKRQGKNAITFGPGAIKECAAGEYESALDRVRDTNE